MVNFAAPSNAKDAIDCEKSYIIYIAAHYTNHQNKHTLDVMAP